MKKHLLSASAIALMVVLSTSCAQNEKNSGENENVIKSGQIAFRASTGKTRANDNALTQVKSGFNVIGLKNNEEYIGGFENPSADKVTYFFNETTPAMWNWKDETAAALKLWPTITTDYPLNFFAAYPLKTAVTKDAVSVNAAVVSNMTPNATFIYNTYYQSVANPLDATKVTVDELSARSLVVGRPASGFADLTFKHIMSNVNFEIIVPTGFVAEVQSIKIANVNRSGRSYNYKNQNWSAEPTYATTNHAHFTHFSAANVSEVQAITSPKKTVHGFSDGATGFNSLKLMPQTVVAKWALGSADTDLNSFKKDAKAWSEKYTTVDEAAIDAWHKSIVASAEKGMADSKGWEGARIELIYRLIDNNSKVVIGKKSGVDGGTEDRFIRIGYALDLERLDVKKDGSTFGLQPGYKYTFQIPLGTASATNGTLLDPDYKDAKGDSTTDPIDTIKPGDPVTKDGIIQFNVAVDDWDSSSATIN